MANDRSVLERQIERVELRPFTLDGFHRRRQRKELNRRIGSAVLALVVAGVTIGGLLRALSPSTTPAPSESFARADGEVLRFTLAPDVPGDPSLVSRALVAVNPETGEERVIVKHPGFVYSAEWSADGRWVAYETLAPEGRGLWVVSASQEPRQVATGATPNLMAGVGLDWMWSPRGAELATLDGSTLHTIDPATGETTDLGTIVGGLKGFGISAWSWSLDGRIAFVAPGGRISSVDVRSEEPSLLVRLPGENLDSIDDIDWSPDGAHVAVVSSSMSSSTGRLYVVDANGSNVRVLVNDLDARGVAWSPDGTRLAFADWSGPDLKVRIWVAPMDGSAPAEIGNQVAACDNRYTCDLTWSPDGSRIAVETRGSFSAFDADGSGEAQPLAELTYRSWDGGSYSCQC